MVGWRREWIDGMALVPPSVSDTEERRFWLEQRLHMWE